jgi:hypothetical protein
MAEHVPPAQHERLAGDSESIKEKDVTSSDTSSQRGPFAAENQQVLPNEKDFQGGREDGKIEITEADCEGELGFSFSEKKKWVSCGFRLRVYKLPYSFFSDYPHHHIHSPSIHELQHQSIFQRP